MRTRSSFLLVPLMLLSMLVVTGCGGDADDASGDSAGGSSLTHLDGVIELADESFTLTPKTDGSTPVTFTFGPEVERAAVRAIAMAGTPARVTYRPSDKPVAALVIPAPEISEELRGYKGLIKAVDDTKIEIDGPDGKRSFKIAAEDREGFDIPHLRDHQKENAPVRVYFDPKTPDLALAYEDA